MIKRILNNNFRITLAILLPVEILSFAANYFGFINIAFFLVFTLILLITLYKLEYGLLIACTELVIGSMGYLFYFEPGEFTLSIRMGIWLIVLSVWLTKEAKVAIDNKKRGISLIEQFRRVLYFIKNNYLAYFLILFLFIGWGVINGYLNGHDFGDLFLDANSYLYFALIFPTYSVLHSRREKISDILSTVSQVFFAGIIWITLKSLFLLYIFSHNLYTTMDILYQWIRDTKVGEITEMSEGVYRIFFQSHIFLIIGFFTILFLFNKYLFDRETSLKTLIKEKKRSLMIMILSLSFLFSVIIIGFSRSFWVGFLAGAIIWLFFTFKQYGWKRTAISTIGMLLATGLSLVLIAGIVNFPYPDPGGSFNASQAASNRAKQAAEGGAAVSSRWSLLPKLWEDIKEAPILGKGYGATITYKSSDPRVLESTVDGEYTTFTFEWGWLDIWLKIGIFGLMCYMMIMGKIFLDGYYLDSKNEWFIKGMIVGMVVLAAVNFFTPFLNHPLGVGYLIITTALLDKLRNNI